MDDRIGSPDGRIEREVRMPSLAIDFGTSTTVAAIRGDGPAGGPRLLAVDGSPLMPSSVFLTDSGTLIVGRDADRRARLDPTRYEPNPKRRIDDGEILLGPAALPVTEVIAAVLRRVATEVRSQFGALPTDVRLTHPARWGRVRLRLLTDAARVAGFAAPTLIPEPVAAATHYANLSDRPLPAGSAVAVYDLGGGTFDAAVVRVDSGEDWNVVSEAGLTDLGGVDFDQALIEHIGAREGNREPAAWARLLQAGDAESRRRLRTLAADVRDAKEALSRSLQAEIPLPPPLRDQTISRPEFEALIRPQLSRTVELLADQLTRIGGPVSGVYLVGGSSRIPLVARLIQERLHITAGTLDQPETSVATGALIDPSRVRKAAPAPAPPAPYAPPPAPAPPAAPAPVPPPKERTRRPYVVAAAVVAAALVTGGLFLLIDRGGGHQSADPGTHRATAAPATTTAPPSSADSPAATTPSPAPSSSASLSYGPNYDAVLPTQAVRAYLRSRYKLIENCRGTGQPEGITDCELKDGLILQVGSDVQFGRYYSRPEGRISDNPSSWHEQRWNSGGHDGRLRNWLRGGRKDNPLLYWDRDGAVWGVLGIAKGKVTTTSAAALMRTWQRNFKG